jgi:hypothetical protein
MEPIEHTEAGAPPPEPAPEDQPRVPEAAVSPVFHCHICEEASSEICGRCTRDVCDNHLCERCGHCSDCCTCDAAR